MHGSFRHYVMHILAAGQMDQNRPSKCPNCGKVRVARIHYEFGRIPDEARDELKAGHAVPAGREPTGNDPRWRCLACLFEWGHPRGLSGSSLRDSDLA